MPPSSHFFFIPGVLLIGAVIGFIVGMRAAADRMALEAKREEERKITRAAREKRKAERAAASDS